MLNAIFWDMDGTLVDSEPLWAEATYTMSELMGKRLTPQQQARTTGANFDFTLDLCAKNAGLNPLTIDRDYWRSTLYTEVKKQLATGLDLLPGVKQLLEAFSAQHMPMYITTNTEREVAEVSFQAIGKHYFRNTLCGDEVLAAKPAPDMYLRAAQLAHSAPQDCLVFEDSVTGVSAALAAGCQVIAIDHDPNQAIPPAATKLSTLHGSPTLDGITTDMIHTWFNNMRKR